MFKFLLIITHEAFKIRVCLRVATCNPRRVQILFMNKIINPRSKLKLARQERNLTQKNVAESIKISRNFYNQIENGSRNPRLEHALSISKLLDLEVEDWN